MARRYDSRTTTFSPEGRLYQVEYALEAINNASITIGIITNGGVILGADKVFISKLINKANNFEKIYKIDDHIFCGVAGLNADANILINQSRLYAQRYLYNYNDVEPVAQLVVQICDIKQSYTQYGGLRPYGVSFLIAGYDTKEGYQLYHTDPSGNYSGWFATAIGTNNLTASSILKQEWKKDMTLQEGLLLAIKTLAKSTDSEIPKCEKIELAYLANQDGKVIQKYLTEKEIAELIKIYTQQNVKK
ncbi:proteasome subunit alpha type-4, putative [Plasmodium berghei]|uniref:Proteasome subunit alpha type n=3 Tax=Plasmodium berghei TaxID=5821 RepID=A0A509APB9_PLABA|nr:proteasome subunit alpha type-4, putative [Plasmodium berghei ANKA]CXI66442.1 proteasome subunit alpha type-4, putative [Plasmodium berghei]SCN26895.1 proteasome subunit alpha type-4, putative [Plasmodium berghei]SCO63316.1 proteasome subunit alpha type-4, putative [Plasmodium berghei]VUC56725.1 proteasome subunit alpha type-4, putative [Plasmodium berghei ANKA]|eukprot:XP_034422511.1 proteasome subunit alpha type-4, putative [Plasmodium berghei ANKA]